MKLVCNLSLPADPCLDRRLIDVVRWRLPSPSNRHPRLPNLLSRFFFRCNCWVLVSAFLACSRKQPPQLSSRRRLGSSLTLDRKLVFFVPLSISDHFRNEGRLTARHIDQQKLTTSRVCKLEKKKETSLWGKCVLGPPVPKPGLSLSPGCLFQIGLVCFFFLKSLWAGEKKLTDKVPKKYNAWIMLSMTLASMNAHTSHPQ